MTRTKPSKTALKREYRALQELGEKLVTLGDDELDRLPIDERLRDAVRAAAGINSRSALRRQKQLIGKLMRHVDPQPIREALDANDATERRARRIFADAERWRDRIVSEGNTGIVEFAARTGTNGQSLADLHAQLEATQQDAAAKRIRRQVFRNVHDALLAQARDDRLSR